MESPEEATQSSAFPDRAEVRDWEVEWSALLAEAESLEAECAAHVQRGLMRPRWMSASQLGDVMADMDGVVREGDQWRQTLWEGLLDVRRLVRELEQNAALGSQPGRLLAASRNLERQVNAFKSEQLLRFEAVADEEEELERFLHTWAPRFDRWVAEPSALAAPSVEPTTCSGSGSPASPEGDEEPNEDDQFRNELAELEATIKACGGRTGGWSSASHDVFLRIFRSFQSEPSAAFYKRAAQWLPDKTQEDVAEHVAWFAEHESLQLQKGQMLQRWRQRRADTTAEAVSEMTSQHRAQLRVAREREERAREETRLRIAEWRRSQTDDRERCVARQRASSEQQSRREREQLQKRQMQNAQHLVAYRMQREKDKAHAREAERVAAAARRLASQEARQRCRQRACDFANRRPRMPQPEANADKPAKFHEGPRTPSREPQLRGPFAPHFRRPLSAGPLSTKGRPVSAS